MIRMAHDKDMFTTPYVFSADEAQAMARAGADIIVCHLGLTTGAPSVLRPRSKLDQCPLWSINGRRRRLRVRRDIIVLVHGGPVSEPQDAEFILRQTRNCHGFYGASSMERLPTERALTEQTRRFKAIKK